MIDKLQTEHHLEFLSLKEGCCSSLNNLSKCHIVGNLMHWLITQATDLEEAHTMTHTQV